MKKINVIIKGLICILTAAIMFTGCSQEDKLAQANVNAMVIRVAVINVLEDLYRQGTPPSGSLIKGQYYNIDIGGKNLSLLPFVLMKESSAISPKPCQEQFDIV